MSWRRCADWLLRLVALAVSHGAPDETASLRQSASRTAVVSRRGAFKWKTVRADGSAGHWVEWSAVWRRWACPRRARTEHPGPRAGAAGGMHAPRLLLDLQAL